MKNIKIILSTDNKSPTITLILENHSEDSYRLPATPLILDGEMKQDNLVVIDKMTHEILQYQGITAKSLPKYITLDQGKEILSNPIDLNLYYDLEVDKSYKVYFKTILTYNSCNFPEELLTGVVESNHIEVIN